LSRQTQAIPDQTKEFNERFVKGTEQLAKSRRQIRLKAIESSMMEVIQDAEDGRRTTERAVPNALLAR
jgi:hypothetical protein